MGNAFKCDKCKYETNVKQKFKDHQLYVHSDVEKKFACELCSFRTTQKEMRNFRSAMVVTLRIEHDPLLGVTMIRGAIG